MTKTKRFCRIEGCTKIVKSQGLCQRHGAKTRLCKVEGCPKQAQGNFDGMCKVCNDGVQIVVFDCCDFRIPVSHSFSCSVSHCSPSLSIVSFSLIHYTLQSHFKQSRVDLKETLVIPSTRPPPPSGQSVYDSIIPASLGFRPTAERPVMPLVAHLKQGFDENRPRGWHRNDERRARGLWPVSKAAMQLTGWERELVWMEILLLSGTPGASFRHLARAWGRDKGFHMVLAQFICERRGNVERKKRPKTGNLKNDEDDNEYYEQGGNAEGGGMMEDILTFEDMEFPIEMLDTLRQSDVESSEGGGSVAAENVHSQAGTMVHAVASAPIAVKVAPVVVPPPQQQVYPTVVPPHVVEHAHSHAAGMIHPDQVPVVAAPPPAVPHHHEEHHHEEHHHDAEAYVDVDPLDEHLLMTQQQHDHAMQHHATAGTGQVMSKEQQATLMTTTPTPI